MKKFFLLALSALMLFAMLAVVYAKKEDGQEGASNIAHITFSVGGGLNYASAASPISGATGRMRYNLSGEKLCFTFNAKGLVPFKCYKLVVKVGGDEVVCLGEGTANRGGNVHINTCANPDRDLEGYITMLVPCEYVECDVEACTLLDLPESELYLVGNSGINFDDTDAPDFD